MQLLLFWCVFGEVAVNNKVIESKAEPFGINGTSYLPLRLSANRWEQK